MKTSTGQQLLKPIPTSRKHHHSSQGVNNKQAGPHMFTTTADPANLEDCQLEVYTAVKDHFENASSTPLRMIVTGTAGTGKSYLIHCIRLLLGDILQVAAPTGVASFIIEGTTLHTLLHLPTRGDFKQLEGPRLQQLQDTFSTTCYIIIDEMSMVGRKMFGQIDHRLRQAFPHCANEVFGGCSVLLFGDFGQLPPVMDLPLYTTDSRSDLSDQGRSAYQQFNTAFILTKVMRQAGRDPAQTQFRGILLRLRDGQVTRVDWEQLMQQTPTNVTEHAPFATALRLYPTVQAVVEHNINKLKASTEPIATIKAVHTGANSAKTSSDDAGGLEAVVYLAKSARVMLTSNLWVQVGLVNGAMGTIQSICYRSGGPPDLPLAIMVKFDRYTGPTLHDGTVPVTPIRRSWSTSGVQCSRLQFPLKLAWAVTIHKSQGLTLDKVVVDIGHKEFSCGLTFVATSRVRRLSDILFNPPFTLQRLSNLVNSHRLRERQLEDRRLQTLQPTSPHSPQSPSPPDYMDELSPSPVTPNMDEHTPSLVTSNMDVHTPSPVTSDYMDKHTPSPVTLDYMDKHTPSPVTPDYMDEHTPSPVTLDYMDGHTPSPGTPDYMHEHTPSPVTHDYMNGHTPSPVIPDYMDEHTPSPVTPDS